MKRFIGLGNNFDELQQLASGCWVNVEAPDREDYAFLADSLNIPQQALDYTSDIDETPRIERDGNYVLTIIRIPVATANPDKPIITMPLSIITCGDFIVTVCKSKNELTKGFILHMRNRLASVPNESTFILHLIYNSAYWFLRYLSDINKKVSEAEKELAKSIKNEDLLELMKLRKTLVYFNTSLRGNQVLISRLHHVFPDDFDLELLEDVEIELKQALNTVNIYTNILDATLDTYASVISNNVNAIMKRMTAATIVLMIPTLIASFYGMNVNISLSSNPYAFWIIVTVGAALAIVTALILRAIRWF